MSLLLKFSYRRKILHWASNLVFIEKFTLVLANNYHSRKKLKRKGVLTKSNKVTLDLYLYLHLHGRL